MAERLSRSERFRSELIGAEVCPSPVIWPGARVCGRDSQKSCRALADMHLFHAGQYPPIRFVNHHYVWAVNIPMYHLIGCPFLCTNSHPRPNATVPMDVRIGQEALICFGRSHVFKTRYIYIKACIYIPMNSSIRLSHVSHRKDEASRSLQQYLRTRTEL
jgi:hypothetical protein